MDILFGDPFYYNIIHHLLPKDLCNLARTCKHYKNTITKKYIKEFVLSNVKNELKRVLGDNYETFIRHVKKMDKHREFNDVYNTYFAIIFKNKYDDFNAMRIYYDYNRDNMLTNYTEYFCDCLFNGIYEPDQSNGYNSFDFFLVAVNKTNNKITKILNNSSPRCNDSLYFFENDTNDMFKLTKYL